MGEVNKICIRWERYRHISENSQILGGFGKVLETTYCAVEKVKRAS